MWSEQAEREHRLLRLRRRGGAALSGQPGDHPAAHMGQQDLEDRPSRLVRAGSGPEGRAVQRCDPRWPRPLTRSVKEIGLPHFVKTSGSSGLHVMIPLGWSVQLRRDPQPGRAAGPADRGRAARDRDRHPTGLPAGRKGVHRLSPERRRPASGAAIQCAGPARRTGIDAASLERGKLDAGDPELYHRERAGSDGKAQAGPVSRSTEDVTRSRRRDRSGYRSADNSNRSYLK